MIGKSKTKFGWKQLIALLMAMAIVITSLDMRAFVKMAYAAENEMITLFFVDNTAEKWVQNDNAAMILVDNTHNHAVYEMTKIDDITWSAELPESAYNITFNRMSSDKVTQWNSWSAGGRDDNNAYFADGGEFGHWEVKEYEEEENYFHRGDVVYLDVSEFQGWKDYNAVFYVNFNSEGKGNHNINLEFADTNIFQPKLSQMKVNDNLYAYIITMEDEGNTELRFWRGTAYELWNSSPLLTYEDYKNGIDCVKITGWDDNGEKIIHNEEIDYDLDSDLDGLTDYNEYVYNTNPTISDTDGDGLSDYEEVAVIGTNPNQVDTDGNGIPDGDEDCDEDGVSNLTEVIWGTSNCTKDTDGDGLSDYDEIYIYGTNPLLIDTDGDGADDRWEVINEFNPINSNDSFSITESVVGVDTSIEIQIEANGDSITSFVTNVHKNDDVFVNLLIPGYIGSAYDFSMDGEFDNAVLKYYFNENLIQENEFIPTIYYYNDEQHILEEIETEWDGYSNYVTANLEHFSTYILLNKTKFEEVWRNDIKKPMVDGNKSNLEVAFVVDLSESMLGTKLSTAKQVVKAFLNVLDNDDMEGLVTFNNSSEIKCNLTNDKTYFSNIVDSMSAGGGTSIYEGINTAINVLGNNKNSYKIMLVFTDGYDYPETTYDSAYKDIIQKAIEKDIIIYTIGIGTVNQEILKKVSDSTKGNYYHASVITELEERVKEIKEEATDLKTDSNNDGISDYYTKLISDGILRTSTGTVIADWIGEYETIQSSDDFDGDGLKNGDEIKVTMSYRGMTCMEVYSDPTVADTDGDNLTDRQEAIKGTNPFVYDMLASDIDIIFDNSLYQSSLFNTEYNNSTVLKAKLGLGNLISNHKWSYANDYKKALMQYIIQYNSATYDDNILEYINDTYNSTLNEVGSELISLQIELLKNAKKINEYNEALYILKQSKEEIHRLEELVKEVKSMDGFKNFEKEFLQTVGAIEANLETQKQLWKGKENVIKNSKITEKLAKQMYKITHKIPSKVLYCVEKVGDIASYGTIVIDTGLDIYETIKLYSSIDVGMIQYAEIDELLSSIIKHSNNQELINAATEVRLLLQNDMSKVGSYINTLHQNLMHGVMDIEIAMLLTDVGPIGVALQIGWNLGDLIVQLGNIDENLLSVITYGESAKTYSEELRKLLQRDTESYYIKSENYIYSLQVLAQLRIIGEDKFAETSNERGWLKEKLDYIMSDVSQKDIEDMCKEIIENLVWNLKKFGIKIFKKFDSSYLY